ncbi:hypothetical protein B0H34DRAFT_796954 [Crassisporium funariophilum]|nr:hypothetical protein B0H34DRAFT_796954 [Crassisporium funariophilum]
MALLPQPNFILLSQHLTNAAAKILLIPNIPPPAPAPTLAQIQELIDNIPCPLLGPTLAQMQELINTAIKNAFSRFASQVLVQLYNTQLPTLCYLPNIQIMAGMPLAFWWWWDKNVGS